MRILWESDKKFYVGHFCKQFIIKKNLKVILIYRSESSAMDAEINFKYSTFFPQF